MSGSYDNTLKVWDAQTGRETLTLNGDQVQGVSFSPDGKRIVSGGGEYKTPEIKIWDISSLDTSE